MTHSLLTLCFTLCSMISVAVAADGNAVKATFDQVKPGRDQYNEKVLHIAGRIKDLKVITEGTSKFSTFFLTDPENPENSIAVKVNLSKKKTVINTFTCTEGEFTTVEGRFKAWGTGSYLGKLEIRDPYAFKCSDAPAAHAAPAVAQKKKPAAEDASPDKPVILKAAGDGSSFVADPNGRQITGTGAVLEPGSVIKTGSHGSVHLKYPDGSKVAVGANSKLVTQAGTKTVQAVNLNFGRVHALISKTKSQKVHFKITTKSATMGVRGTQFFVDSEKDGKTTTSVVNGQVDVARKDSELLTDKAKPVFREEQIDVENGTISEKRHFDVQAYLAKLRAEEPDLMAISTEEAKAAEPVPVPVARAPVPETAPAGCEGGRHEERARLANFRIGAVSEDVRTEEETHTDWGWMITWNPETNWDGRFNLAWDVGYGNLHSTLEYALVGIVSFNEAWALELRGGAHTATSPATVTSPFAGGALKFEWNEHTFLNSVIVGVDRVLPSGEAASNSYNVALGFHF